MAKGSLDPNPILDKQQDLDKIKNINLTISYRKFYSSVED